MKLFEIVKITETKRRQNGLKIGPRCGHVWLTSYPGPRAGFFLLLRGSGSLISCREKSRKTSETGVLTSRVFTCNWNPVYFPVCRFGYKKIDSRTRFVDVCILKKIVGEAWQYCRGVTCEGLASRPGGVEILLAASCYRNGVSLGCYEPVGSKASLFR